MKIALDGKIFIQRHGGISRYFCEISKIISQQENCNLEICAPIYTNEYLSRIQGVSVFGMRVPRAPFGYRLTMEFNRIVTGLRLSHSPPDILHETYYGKHVDITGRGRRVLTVYDMIHEKFPQIFPINDRTIKEKYESLMRSDKIICISENTKKDLLNIYPIDASLVSVVHLGTAFSKSTHHSSNRKTGDYILYVGQRWGYKNFIRLLKAISISKALVSEVRLVCFGGGPLSQLENECLMSLGFRDGSVVQMDGDDEALMELYARAKAFVYPSLYEGFGIPLLEAMAMGCPVVCSNSSCFPEIAGNAAEYFDPLSELDMSEAIQRVVFDDNRASELAFCGTERTGLFSWTQCAMHTLDIYRSLL